MQRRAFVKHLGLLALTPTLMKSGLLTNISTGEIQTDKMPVLFMGHGNPMNAIEENQFVQGFRSITTDIPTPTAILVISAHWETNGTRNNFV